MGEAKRKAARLSPVERQALKITQDLADQGKLIEGGFAAWLMMNKIDPLDPRMPLLRDAYMSSAEHMWSSVMAVLEDEGDDEPTEKDMQRMSAVHKEISDWRENKLSEIAMNMKTEGNG